MKLKNDILKKAVFFCPTKNWGGIEKNLLLRCHFLSAKGYEIHVVLLKDTFAHKFEGIENITVKTITKRGGDLNLLVVLNYVRLLKKIRPYMVFAALKKDWWLVSLSAYLAKVPNKILYLGNIRKIRKGLKYFLVFRILKGKVLVNSDSIKNDLLANGNYFTENNLFRIYNGVDLPAEKPIQINWRKELNLNKDTKLIGCAGWINRRKGFDLLPDILQQLPDNVHVIHVGKEIEADLKPQILKNPKSRERVHFLGHQNDMDSFFKNIDVFLLCSRSEGLANVLNEALSYGKPIVSTKAPGSEELLEHGTYGILTEIEDTKAMAKGILDILHSNVTFDPEKLKHRITTQFSLEKMMEQTESLFFNQSVQQNEAKSMTKIVES